MGRARGLDAGNARVGADGRRIRAEEADQEDPDVRVPAARDGEGRVQGPRARAARGERRRAGRHAHDGRALFGQRPAHAQALHRTQGRHEGRRRAWACESRGESFASGRGGRVAVRLDAPRDAAHVPVRRRPRGEGRVARACAPRARELPDPGVDRERRRVEGRRRETARPPQREGRGAEGRVHLATRGLRGARAGLLQASRRRAADGKVAARSAPAARAVPRARRRHAGTVVHRPRRARRRTGRVHGRRDAHRGGTSAGVRARDGARARLRAARDVRDAHGVLRDGRLHARAIRRPLRGNAPPELGRDARPPAQPGRHLAHLAAADRRSPARPRARHEPLQHPQHRAAAEGPARSLGVLHAAGRH